MPPRARKSSLPAKTNAKRNTEGGRAKMADSSFALPEQKKYRIDDAAHARNALARAAQHATPAEQARIRRAVAKKYPSIDQGGAKKSSTRKSK
jgi:hypothetical protein